MLHTNATRIGWHLWEIDLRFAPGLPPGWQRAIMLSAGNDTCSQRAWAGKCRLPRCPLALRSEDLRGPERLGNYRQFRFGTLRAALINGASRPIPPNCPNKGAGRTLTKSVGVLASFGARAVPAWRRARRVAPLSQRNSHSRQLEKDHED